jgi:phosphotransferase system  glucose/maltose/N-acetylglucosamine-specific IIC component
VVNQTRAVSLVEQVLNVGSGFALSFVIWQTVGPLLGYVVDYATNFLLTATFTVASLVRGYCWRRFFNAGLHQSVTRWVRGFYGR